ncbi:hypothetical protein [Spirosoma areae]
MKTSFRFPLVAVVASLLFVSALAQAQNTPANPPRYKDVVVDNPTAEADMNVVGGFVNALVSGDVDKAKSLVSATYMGHGPAATDSSTTEQTITRWQQTYKTQMNRKVSFVTQTFRVAAGNLKGNWVSLWGDYTFTEAGKAISFPFQYTARVADGTIMSDRIYYDRSSILTQLGFTITPPEVAKK